MVAEEAFLDEILAHAEQDAPRLIYADWLEEHGHPRGEFIRVQCQLARLHDGDVRRRPLLKTERRLLDEHEVAWTPRMRRAPVDNLRFRRGFPEQVTLDAETFLRDGPALFKAIPTLQSLQLRSVRRLITTLYESACLALPTEISLRSVAAGDMQLSVFAGSEHLRELRALDLAWAGLSDLWGLGQRECAFASLQQLDLSMNPLDGQELRRLVRAPFWRGLRALYLGSTRCDGETLDALLVAEPPARLQRLGLSNLQLGTDVAFTVARASQLARLRWLSLGNNRLTRRAARAIGGSPTFTHLEYLDLGNNDLGDDGAAALAEGSFPVLQVLDLRNTNIGEGGAVALARSDALPDNLSIDLRFNPLSESARNLLTSRFGDHVRV